MKNTVDPEVLSPISEDVAINKIHRVLQRVPVELHLTVIVEAVRKRQLELREEAEAKAEAGE